MIKQNPVHPFNLENRVQDDMKNPDKPPLFPSWTYWYVFIIAFLLLQILFFNFFTRTYQ